MKVFTAYIEFDPETELYVGIVPGLPGAHTQGATLDELQHNLAEVVELCLEEYQGSREDLPRHPSRDIARPLLREILREIELTPDQFREELAQL